MKGMTREEFQFIVDIKKEYEFLANGKRYTLTYGKDDSGKDYIALGRLYDQPERYASFGDLMNHAKIENQYVRELIAFLEP
ncbi:MAG: hypothetical protein IJ828_01350 [Treponema sp.]|nr:hypothetical protein [Treponema sp.]